MLTFCIGSGRSPVSIGPASRRCAAAPVAWGLGLLDERRRGTANLARRGDAISQP